MSFWYWRTNLTWEQWLQEQKIKLVLLAFGGLFLSMVMSCQELRYMVSGKVVEVGANARDETQVDRYGVKSKHRLLTYQYTDGNESRGQTIEVPLDWTGDPNGMAKIQYIPGRDASRLLGQSNRVWVIIFFTTLALSVVGLIVILKSG